MAARAATPAAEESLLVKLEPTLPLSPGPSFFDSLDNRLELVKEEPEVYYGLSWKDDETLSALSWDEEPSTVAEEEGASHNPSEHEQRKRSCKQALDVTPCNVKVCKDIKKACLRETFGPMHFLL
jgi:hypothetical protein